MEEIKGNELITVNDRKEIVIAANAEEIIKFYFDEAAKASEKVNQVKEAIRKALVENKINKAEIGNYTFSLRFKSSTWVFDTNKFLEEQSDEVKSVFVRKVVTEHFDLDRFKSENPELYEKYVTRTETTEVDENALYEKLPSVYNKYATEIKNTAEPTLMTKEK